MKPRLALNLGSSPLLESELHTITAGYGLSFLAEHKEGQNSCSPKQL